MMCLLQNTELALFQASTHRNACVSTGFSSGKHRYLSHQSFLKPHLLIPPSLPRWYATADGLNDHYWVAMGVTTDAEKPFSYTTGTYLVIAVYENIEQ